MAALRNSNGPILHGKRQHIALKISFRAIFCLKQQLSCDSANLCQIIVVIPLYILVEHHLKRRAIGSLEDLHACNHRLLCIVRSRSRVLGNLLIAVERLPVVPFVLRRIAEPLPRLRALDRYIIQAVSNGDLRALGVDLGGILGGDRTFSVHLILDRIVKASTLGACRSR